MDAPLTLARLMEDFDVLTESKDFVGAEELLFFAMGSMPKHESFFHFQLGRLYSRWNKMTSAVNHLNKAAELSLGQSDEVLAVQILAELKNVRRMQLEQAP